MLCSFFCFFFFSSRRRHTRFDCDWSSDVCSSDLLPGPRKARSTAPRKTSISSSNGYSRDPADAHPHEGVSPGDRDPPRPPPPPPPPPHPPPPLPPPPPPPPSPPPRPPPPPPRPPAPAPPPCN